MRARCIGSLAWASVLVDTAAIELMPCSVGSVRAGGDASGKDIRFEIRGVGAGKLLAWVD